MLFDFRRCDFEHTQISPQSVGAAPTTRPSPNTCFPNRTLTCRHAFLWKQSLFLSLTASQFAQKIALKAIEAFMDSFSGDLSGLRAAGEGPRRVCLAALPGAARALVAVRVARRACLAMLVDPGQQEAALAACDAIERLTLAPTPSPTSPTPAASQPAMAALGKVGRSRETEAALEAVRLAWESLGDPGAVSRTINAVCGDERVSSMQIAIVVAADIDQLTFACEEAGIGQGDGLSAHVLGRLAPCHALHLGPWPRNIEEEYR